MTLRFNFTTLLSIQNFVLLVFQSLFFSIKLKAASPNIFLPLYVLAVNLNSYHDLGCLLGSWAKKILLVINMKYPSELRGAVHNFLEVCLQLVLFLHWFLDMSSWSFVSFFWQNTKVQSNKEDTVYEVLCKMLDGNIDMSDAISDSKIWFALQHPKVCSMEFHKNYELITCQHVLKSSCTGVMKNRPRFDVLHFLVWAQLEFWKQRLLTRRYFRFTLLYYYVVQC